MQIPKEIQKAIQENKLVIFAGAGLSLKFNLPNWQKIVCDVIETLDIDAYKNFLPLLSLNLMTPIEVLAKIKSEHTEIRRYLKNNFDIKGGDLSLHKKLLDLSEQIITTNFDNAFEKASQNTIHPSIYTSNFNISEINKANVPYILKLHGSFNEPDNCILFEDDYKNLYSKDNSAIQKLKSIFTEKTILFLGFSFSDIDINLIFENLDLLFKNNNKHFNITAETNINNQFNFIENIKIQDYNEIDSFIDECLLIKSKHKKQTVDLVNIESKEVIKTIRRIAFLTPDPIDFDVDVSKVLNYFDGLEANIQYGSLNFNTLNNIDDYDLLIIATKKFKNRLYIEEDNLKSTLVTTDDICQNIPNDKIPIVFITDAPIQLPKGIPIINITSYKNAVINKFVYKVLRSCELPFNDENIIINLTKVLDYPINKGTTKFSSIYNTNPKNVELDKKSLTNVIGRVEEQASIASRLINIRKSNKFLNIKASGGTGKTTIVKKVAYELYNRGYFTEGITFKSCESIKSYEDFEELLISGFNLTNILDFKNYLIEIYTFQKKDLLIILDNFETIANILDKSDFLKVIDLLKFATDYGNIVLTSREKVSLAEDFEDVFSLTPLTTDDALILFEKNYGTVSDSEIKILRTDILEDILNNNPLAIKLVTKSRTRFNHILELKEQLIKYFFESTNEDYALVYNQDADLNIERTKSLFQSINYSYITLSNGEKLAFELLHLFPDGISLSNFKTCFEKNNSLNKLNDRNLRTLRDKSLVEDSNGILHLQPIIRKFAEYQFMKRDLETKEKYFLDAYRFNCHVLKYLRLIKQKNTTSAALLVFNSFKNNLLYVLYYMPEIGISETGIVKDKKYLLNYIYLIEDFIVNNKLIKDFESRLNNLREYFSDLPDAELLIEVLNLYKIYFHKEFDNSYKKILEILPINKMEERVFDKENHIIGFVNDQISNIHSMEGNTLQFVASHMNSEIKIYLGSHLFYLGIPGAASRKREGFYHFEYTLMFNSLDPDLLTDYIDSLYKDEHLEIIQCTYTLSKVITLDKERIRKLVVTNPYTKGLKELMYAFISEDNSQKETHFKLALKYLSHIKYYYLEALYYYCLFLKKSENSSFEVFRDEGIDLSQQFHYQYLYHLFLNINNNLDCNYSFNYSFYPLLDLEHFVAEHNRKWEQVFKRNKI